MKENFDHLVELAMRDAGRAHMRPVIEKELLHYDILFALSEAKLLDTLTFQGGTSLRLCHGAPRFSEDLDFAGGPGLDTRRLQDIKQCLEDYLGSRYGLDVRVRAPQIRGMDDGPAEPGHTQIAKWRISIQTAPSRPDLPRQRIKLEVADIPAYTRDIKSLARNYPFLPDGYADVLLGVESLDEIMADKLVSLPACVRYVRHRDIWDLRWLKQQGASPDVALVERKIEDYGEADYLDKLRAMIDRLGEIVRGTPFTQEMSRFIPQDVQDRTLHRNGFGTFLTNEVQGLLRVVEKALDSGTRADDSSFPM